MLASPAAAPRDAVSAWSRHDRLAATLGQLGWPAAAAVGYVLVHAAWLAFQWGPEWAHRYIADAFLVPPFIAPALGAWLVAARAETVPTARRAWRFLGASYFLLFVANLVWLVSDFTHPAELIIAGRWLVVACYPPLLIGLFLFPAAPRRSSARVQLALDVGTVVVASALVVWYVLIRPRAGVPGLGLVPPVADVGVVLAIATILLRRPDPASRSALRMLAAGHFVAIGAGIAAGVRVILGVRSPGGWVDTLWMSSDLLIFLATRFPSGAREASPEMDAEMERVSAFPYVFVAFSLALLLFASRALLFHSALGIVILGNAVILGLVVGRQLLALRENRRLLVERHAQEARFRSLVQHASDVVSLVGPHGTIEYLAPAAERVFGIDIPSWQGRLFLDLAHADDRAAIRELLERARAGGGAPVRGAWHATVGDGRVLALETVAALTTDGPDAGKLVLATRDVTDRLQLEERLRHSQKLEAVGRLAGGVAHDFNNLLAAIRCHAALIREDTPVEDPRAIEAREIELSIDRAVGLTRQLLTFSRKQVLRPTRLELGHVVRTTERLVRRLVGESVAVRISYDVASWPVLADAGQLELVVMNLAVNARDAMPDGGVLTIETGNATVDATRAAAEPGLAAGDYATLTVRDTGVGMSSDVVAHLFEPFFTTKERGKGTGLGLSTVFGIVTHAAGHVAVESAPGRGSAFTVYLPRAGGDEPARAGAASPPESGATLVRDEAGRGAHTVLVVDDEISIRTAIRRILERAGYAVLVAEDGEDALRIARERAGRIDLLLTDMAMPRMDGTHLVAEFARRYPSARIIRMSGYAEGEGVRAQLSNVATAFVAKPFTVETITAAVHDALAERAVAAV
jgi:PAS domain S-box-containing protein